MVAEWFVDWICDALRCRDSASVVLSLEEDSVMNVEIITLGIQTFSVSVR